MHGLINRSLEDFIGETYGHEFRRRIMDELDAGFDSFEAMMSYDDTLTWAFLDSVAAVLGKPQAVLLEDLGTFLISHPSSHRLRRLLRFGGVDYEEFLHSLGDLPGRAKLAVPDLGLPDLDMFEKARGEYELRIHWAHEGFGHVAVGALRAMADDYGALALVEYLGTGIRGERERVAITLLDMDYTEGRSFDLAATGS